MDESGGKEGMADLEKELTCSICTDLLYQPLTLLDCLHTFCGACLKEWFQFQASTATSLHPYTCPACRASVRGTKPNATVTTLLDIFLKGNPGRGKSEEEKKADRSKYKPGDNVLPKLRKREDPGAEEERRMIAEVQQMSLRELGIPSSNLQVPRESTRREQSRERSRDSSPGRSRARSRETRHRESEGRSHSRNPEPSSTPREPIPSRQVEHQASLRSLLSASDVDPNELEAEIMRQITEEGLLDEIDLDNIDIAEDELSERIAQAYKRRQREKRRERLERHERRARDERERNEHHVSPASHPSSEARNEASGHASQEESRPRRRTHGRSESSSGPSIPPAQSQSSRPPISRPGLIEAANQGARTHHRRSSSQGSSGTGRRSHRPDSLSISSTRPAARSSVDVTERTQASVNDGIGARRRMSDNQQHNNVDERQEFRNNVRSGVSSNSNSPRRPAFPAGAGGPSSSTRAVASPSNPPDLGTMRRTTDPTHSRQIRASVEPSQALSPTLGPRHVMTEPSSTETTSRASSMVAAVAPTFYPEPNISCKRCGKEHIEHDVHYNCSRCDQGNYNLCLSCYRQGKGCEHWFGFGWAAWPRYERAAPTGGYPPNHPLPHILVGHRYRRPVRRPSQSLASSPQQIMTTENPLRRLESGVFCDMCSAFANACYWKCDICNEGAWGFCNDCINQRRHCTHPLLPIAHKSSTKAPSTETGESTSLVPPSENNPRSPPNTPGLAPPESSLSPTTPPLTPKSASLIRGPGLITIANMIFRPLTFTTICNICTYPIPPSHTRFHCPQCNQGDYDICTPCYHKLVSTKRISTENGMHGWRRCLRGHRMIVVGFEDRGGGQRRVVTRDLVGGLTLKEEETVLVQSESPHAQRPSGNSVSQAQQRSLWSWRDSDGSIHRYSVPHAPSSASHSTSSPAATQTRFPPDGGIGLRLVALWSYYPADGVSDELMFPKHAEICEAENINGDWFWGCYAGSKGLFPGNYVRLAAS